MCRENLSFSLPRATSFSTRRHQTASPASSFPLGGSSHTLAGLAPSNGSHRSTGSGQTPAAPPASRTLGSRKSSKRSFIGTLSGNGGGGTAGAACPR